MSLVQTATPATALVAATPRDPDLVDLAARIVHAHRRGLEHAGAAVAYWMACGEMLIRAKEAVGHGNFYPWLDANVPDFGHRQAQKYMRAAKGADRIQDLRVPPTPGNANSGSHLAGALRLLAGPDPRHGTRSGDAEYYARTRHIEASRRVMRGIGLDPFSCDEAQKRVRAERFYTKADDAFTRDWCDRPFVHPPYTKGVIEPAVAKLLAEIDAGRVTTAILLAPASVAADWWQAAARRAAALCFPDGRIPFLRPGGAPADNPIQASSFLYYGPDPVRFVGEFRAFGVAWPLPLAEGRA
jgi:hypothetical protein